MSDFDWNPKDVTIPAQDALAVVETADDNILIVQQGLNGDEDDVVAVHRRNLPVLIKALSDLVEKQA